jgi:hypothetical protein
LAPLSLALLLLHRQTHDRKSLNPSVFFESQQEATPSGVASFFARKREKSVKTV